MIRKVRFKPVSGFAAIASLVCLLAFGGSAQQGGWKGKIQMENGIKVVLNPDVPLYGRVDLDLEEELRIGKEGDARMQFYRIRDISADSLGNIYVVTI